VDEKFVHLTLTGSSSWLDWASDSTRSFTDMKIRRGIYRSVAPP